nr:MAG TPA: hypothetical protein [Herelleviridae sp.]
MFYIKNFNTFATVITFVKIESSNINNTIYGVFLSGKQTHLQSHCQA